MEYVKMKSWSVQYKDLDIFSEDSEYEVWISGMIQMKKDEIFHNCIIKDVCRVDEDSDLFYIYTDEFECTKDVDASGKCNLFLVDAKDKAFNMMENFLDSEEMKDKKISNGLRENPDFIMLSELASQREKEKVERQEKKVRQMTFFHHSRHPGIFFPIRFRSRLPEMLLHRS